MPIGTIESNKQVYYKLVYGKADGIPNSLESMVVCDSCKKFRDFDLIRCHYTGREFYVCSPLLHVKDITKLVS
jgi:hypothetical protein